MVGLRSDNTLASSIDRRLADLVHESGRQDLERTDRQATFLASRLTMGAVALAAFPAYLLARGPISAAEAAVAAGLGLCVVSAVVLMQTGRLVLAQGLASAGLAALVACVAFVSGGVFSPALPWLLAIPADAAPTGSRRAVVAATGIALLTALGLAVATGLDLVGTTRGPGVLAPLAFAVVGAAHLAAGLVAGAARRGRRTDAAHTRAQRDQALLAVIGDLVTWHDPTGSVIEASESAQALVGTSPASLLGRGLLGRIHIHDRPAFLKALGDAAQGPHPTAAQVRLHVGPTPNAGVIWMEMRAHRVVSPHRRETSVVALMRDVSEHRRRAEELEITRAEAEQADEVKSRFLATVSHELRTPLNAIIGFSEMLAGDLPLDAPRRREYAEIVHGSGLHLLDVVNALLDMSRIQSGNFDFAPDPVDPRAVVAGCCDLMQIKADQAGVTLVRDVGRNLPELVADPRACRQMLLNLISNAIKFTPRGGRVTVSAKRAFDRIDFAVADTGQGIAESDLPRLGEPFFQAGEGYSRRHEGTGLGLSVVRGLVGLHHGEMAIESAATAGTRVTVSLPIDCRGGVAPGGAAPIRTLVRRVAEPERAVPERADVTPMPVRLFG